MPLGEGEGDSDPSWGLKFRMEMRGQVVGGAPRNRSCARREARGRISHCAARRFFCGSLPMLAPARSRCRLLGVWCGRGVRLSAFGYGCAERFWVFRRGGALWFWRWGGMPWGLCGIDPALAGKLGGGSAFALRAGFLWIASNARSGSIPLPLGDPSSGSDLGWRCGGAGCRWGAAGLIVRVPGLGRPLMQMQMWLGRRRFPVQPLGLIP